MIYYNDSLLLENDHLIKLMCEVCIVGEVKYVPGQDMLVRYITGKQEIQFLHICDVCGKSKHLKVKYPITKWQPNIL